MEDKKNLEAGLGAGVQKRDWSLYVPNQYWIEYKVPGFPEEVRDAALRAEKQKHIDTLVQALSENGFRITQVSQVQNRMTANYAGSLSPDEVLRMNLSKYNVTAIMPVPQVRMHCI